MTAATPPTLDDLKARRATIGERLADLDVVRNRLKGAEDDERAALNALSDLGLSELAAMTAWASEGAQGPAPALDHAARTSATANLATMQAKAIAARGAGADIDDKIAAAHRESATLASAIERAAVTLLAAEFEADRAEIATMASDLRDRLAQALGLVQFLRERSSEHRDAGRAAEAAAIDAVVISLPEAMPATLPNLGDVAAATPAWNLRLQELTK